MPRNRQIVLVNRPGDQATTDNFKLIESDTPALQEGQVLVRHHYLSLDPYMRGRMNDSKSYAASQHLGCRHAGGKLRPRESMAHGLHAAPQAFLGLLKGDNLGKQLVQLI